MLFYYLSIYIIFNIDSGSLRITLEKTMKELKLLDIMNMIVDITM